MPKPNWKKKVTDKAQVLWAAMRLAYGKYPVAKKILASNAQMKGTSTIPSVPTVIEKKRNERVYSFSPALANISDSEAYLHECHGTFSF